MARAESIRIIIAMAAQFKLKLHHLDVKFGIPKWIHRRGYICRSTRRIYKKRTTELCS